MNDCHGCYWHLFIPSMRDVETGETLRGVRYCSHPKQVGRETQLCDLYMLAPEWAKKIGSGEMKKRVVETVEIEAKILRESEKALLVKWDPDKKPEWVPKSQVVATPLDRWTVTLEMPDWLAREKGMI